MKGKLIYEKYAIHGIRTKLLRRRCKHFHNLNCSRFYVEETHTLFEATHLSKICVYIKKTYSAVVILSKIEKKRSQSFDYMALTLFKMRICVHRNLDHSI